MGRIFNKTEFAELRGVDARTVGRWMDDGLPFQGGKKKGAPVLIDLEDAIAWECQQFFEKQTGGKFEDVVVTKVEEELKKLVAERKIKESESELKRIELDEKEKTIVDINLVEQVVVEAFTQMSMILKPTGRNIVPKVYTARNEAEGLQIWDDELARAFVVANGMLAELDIDGSTFETNHPSDGECL